MPLKTIQAALLKIFQMVGMPQHIKVDNGRPFGDPQRQTIPILALFLTGLGIKVITNRFRTPQDNAKVERSQGVLSNWTEWHKCHHYLHLQCRLWRETDFHNYSYPVQRLGGKTRIEAFPNLLQSPNPFNPNIFYLQNVLEFVATGTWERQVSQNGQFSFWGQRINLSTKYARQIVSIKLDPLQNKWLCFDKAANLIHSFDSNISAHNLWNLDLCPVCQ